MSEAAKKIKSYNISTLNADFLEREGAIEGISASEYLDRMISEKRKHAPNMPMVSKAFLKGGAE